MKKTVIVNISGVIFHIDEDAYEKLGHFISALHKYFDQQPEGKEIVDDIEARIAELFQPKINGAKQSITLEDIEEIIGILGQPEDIAESSAESEGLTVGANNKPVFPNYKKLYRDTDHAMLGGVCSGIGVYLDIDPVILRVLYLFFMIGAIFMPSFLGNLLLLSLFIMYPVLWIIVPKAQTAAQKLQMRGEEVTVDSIGKSIQNEYRQRENKQNSFALQMRDFVGRVLRGIYRFFYTFWKTCGILLGILLVIISVIFIASVLVGLFNANMIGYQILHIQNISVINYVYHIVTPTVAVTLLILGLIGVLLPLIGVAYAGLKLILKDRLKGGISFILPLLMIWLGSVIAFVVVVSVQAAKFKNEISTTDTFFLKKPSKKILYIQPDSLFSFGNSYVRNFRYYRMCAVTKIKGEEVLYSPIDLHIKGSEDDSMSMEVIKNWRGNDDAENQEQATADVRLNYVQADTVFRLSQAFWTSGQKCWRFYHVRVVLKIPIGTKILLEPKMQRILNYQSLNFKYRNSRQKIWEVDKDGLKPYLGKNSRAEYIKKVFNEPIVFKTRSLGEVKDEDIKLMQKNGTKMYLDTDSGLITFGVPILSFRSTSEDTIRTIIGLMTSGRNLPRNFPGRMNQRNFPGRINHGINYNCQLKENVLYIDPVWYCKGKYTSKEPIKVTVFIPEAAKVRVHEKLFYLLNPSDQYLIGKTWRIRNNEFYEINKKYFTE